MWGPVDPPPFLPECVFAQVQQLPYQLQLAHLPSLPVAKNIQHHHIRYSLPSSRLASASVPNFPTPRPPYPTSRPSLSSRRLAPALSDRSAPAPRPDPRSIGSIRPTDPVTTHLGSLPPLSPFLSSPFLMEDSHDCYAFATRCLTPCSSLVFFPPPPIPCSLYISPSFRRLDPVVFVSPPLLSLQVPHFLVSYPVLNR